MEPYLCRKKNNDKIKTNLPIPSPAPVTAFLIAEKVLSYDWIFQTFSLFLLIVSQKLNVIAWVDYI